MWTSQKMSLADAVCSPLLKSRIREGQESESNALISKALH